MEHMSTKQKLDRLSIYGFQSIRSLENLELHDINVLIGANGAGKSNFVNFFRMMSELVEQRLQIWTRMRGGANRLLYLGVKQTQNLSSELWFGEYGYEFFLQPTDNDGFVFSSEYLHTSHKYLKPMRISSGDSETQIKTQLSSHNNKFNSNYCYYSISSWQIFQFNDTSNTAGVKQWVSVDDAKSLRSDASNLAAYLYRVRQQHPDVYNQILKTIQLALPFFDDFVLDPQPLRDEDWQVRLLWHQHNSDYPMSPTQLSDGSIRFICLTTALLQPNPPSTIIIDEPELGLHPYAITLLGSLMRSASKRMQLIVSTQSVPLLNEFDLEDLIIVERENDASVFKRLNAEDFQIWLEDYTVGELWEKNILGGRPS